MLNAADKKIDALMSFRANLVMCASASFVIDAAIHGYHVSKEIWPNPIDGE